MSNSKFEVKALTDQCTDYILMHLEEYPSAYLALLPLRLRRRILWRLPMADACRLEDTQFVNDISMEEEYWESVYCLNRDRGCIATYLEEQRKSGLPKAIATGTITSICLGLLRMCNSNFLVYDDDEVAASILVLFGVRDKESVGQVVRKSNIVIPPRHQWYTLCTSKEELLGITTDFFPQDQFAYLYMEGIEEGDCGRILSHMPQFRNLRYLTFEHDEFGPTIQDLIIRITREAAKLEVLCLQYEPADDRGNPTRLDEIILQLAVSSFMSTMHVLMAYSLYSEANMDTELFSVTYGILKKFMEALIGATCTADHRQVLRLEGVAILCNSIVELQELLNLNCCSSNKVIEIYNCKFCVVNGTLLQ
jgi:hypothetical protein